MHINIGDKVERITGDARNRGIVIELDEEKQRARIDWTERQKYEVEFVGNNWRTKTTWTGEFKPFTYQPPRTWTKYESLKTI